MSEYNAQQQETGMFYVWQANTGRWFVDAFTRAGKDARRLAVWTEGCDTRAEAEAKRVELQKTLDRMKSA